MVEATQTDKGVTAIILISWLPNDPMLIRSFAYKNKETLVIVVGDHETGGLTLLTGSLKDG